MDRPHQIFHGGLEFYRGYSLGDQFGRLRSNNVYAQNLTVISIGDDLDETLVLADN